MGKVFVFDAAKCNGCRNCQIACKDEHVDNDWSPWSRPQPDTGHFWCRIEERVRGQVPKVRVSYVMHRCQHCENAPCMAAAPEAVYRREDGLVIVDPEANEVVPGARVTAENLATGEVLATEADEFGDFWFHQVGAAGWRVYAEAEGYLTRVLEASTVDEDRNMGPIELYRAEE